VDPAFECHRKRRIRGDVASAPWRICRLVVFGAVSGRGSDAWPALTPRIRMASTLPNLSAVQMGLVAAGVEREMRSPPPLPPAHSPPSL
jgi:hypothetical protein